jgi:hypothetical protein
MSAWISSDGDDTAAACGLALSERDARVEGLSARGAPGQGKREQQRHGQASDSLHRVLFT